MASPQQPVSQARKDTAETHFTGPSPEAQGRQGLSMVLSSEKGGLGAPAKYAESSTVVI